LLLWFAGGSFVAVWAVFRSPALDYRLVMLGAILPLADLVYGGARPLHTLLACVVVLLAVMLATRDRRLIRRQWLGLPIGMFLHLVLDGVWTRAHLFWWPLFGSSFGTGHAPELTRGVDVDLLLEVLGALALVWAWRRFQLADPARRRRFLHTGQLSRDLMRGPEAGM
jgi:membrane-bound metal-dependent hydrolase YbcI (DUF457 family)